MESTLHKSVTLQTCESPSRTLHKLKKHNKQGRTLSEHVHDAQVGDHQKQHENH